MPTSPCVHRLLSTVVTVCLGALLLWGLPGNTPAAEMEAPVVPEPPAYQPPELTPEELEQYQFESSGDPRMKVEELSLGQTFIMRKQRMDIGALMARRLGILNLRDNLSDLDLIQRIVDEKLIAKEDTQLWQALGVVFGDLIARELDLHWVQVEDELGVSRALQVGESQSFVFPVTMLSKRVQFDQDIHVREIYDKVVKEVERYRHLDRLKGLNDPAERER